MKRERDFEELLAQVRLKGPSAALRERVIEAVGAELNAARPTAARASLTRVARWQRRLGFSAVAALLLAVGLNVLAYRAGEARFASFRHPAPEPRYIADITETVESATDAETARLIRRRLVADWRANRSSAADAWHSYQRLLQQAALLEREICHVEREKTPFSPKMDGDRSGRSRGDTSYDQRHRRVDHGFTC